MTTSLQGCGDTTTIRRQGAVELDGPIRARGSAPRSRQDVVIELLNRKRSTSALGLVLAILGFVAPSPETGNFRPRGGHSRLPSSATSLRRPTKPLRVFPGWLARGACRPPSIPTATAAFERVPACPLVGSTP